MADTAAGALELALQPRIKWDLDDIIDTDELARRTGTGASTWTKRRMRGPPESPPYMKLGRSVRYRWGDVIEWMRKQTRNSTSEAA